MPPCLIVHRPAMALVRLLSHLLAWAQQRTVRLRRAAVVGKPAELERAPGALGQLKHKLDRTTAAHT